MKKSCANCSKAYGEGGQMLCRQAKKENRDPVISPSDWCAAWKRKGVRS